MGSRDCLAYRPDGPRAGRVHRGRHRRTYLEGFIRAFGAWQINTRELIDLGGDEVLSVLTVGGSPLGQTDQQTQFLDWAWIVSVRDGKITHVRSFLDKDRAFEAAGMSE